VSETSLQSVQKNFYVDDYLQLFSTKEEAVQIVSEIRKLLSAGGFHLCKFISNNREVLATLPEDDRDNSVKCLDLDNTLPVSKTFGIYWNAETDCLEVKVNVSTKPPTCRGILFMMSHLFDPLGFLHPLFYP